MVLSSLSKIHVFITNWSKIGFPTGQDSATFQDSGSGNFFLSKGQRDTGKEVPSLSRDKGTVGQAQNLATGPAGTHRDGPGQPKSGPGHGTKRDRAEEGILK